MPEELTQVKSFECKEESRRYSYKKGNWRDSVSKLRMVGGGQYDVERFPSYVFIRHHNQGAGSKICGGVLIGRSSDLVMTSSDCVNPKDSSTLHDLEVVAGVSSLDSNSAKEKKGQLRGVKLACRNSNYNLVLVQLKSGFMQNGAVQTACLAKENHQPRGNCFTIGSMEAPFSNKTQVTPMIRNCIRKDWNIEYSRFESCYRSVSVGGPCSYDHGAPMLCVHTCNHYEPLRTYLVGVYSRTPSTDFNCKENIAFPSFYTDLYKIRNQLSEGFFFDDCYRLSVSS